MTGGGVLRVPVFVEDWQIECCGTAPAIGDRVRWTLVFTEPDPDGAPDPAAEVTLDAVARAFPMPPSTADPCDPVPDATIGQPTVLATGGLRAFWFAGTPAAGSVRVIGRLLEDHHGSTPAGFPPTVGTVTRVRVATQQFVPHTSEPRTYVRHGAPAYRDVRRSPDHFRSPIGPDGPGPFSGEDGVLVDLTIGPDGPAPE